MIKENWIYRAIVILCLCILLVYTYLTNEETFINYITGKFILDTRLIWQIGIFALLCVVLFYLLESTLDYKAQNEVLKGYLEKMQRELNIERQAIKILKSESGDKILKMSSFTVTLSDMAKELTSVLDPEALLKTLLTRTSELLGSEKCAIFNLARDKKSLRLVDAIGYDKDELSKHKIECNESSGMIGLSAQDGKFYSAKSIYDDYNKRHILDNDKFQVEFCQPIVHNTDVLAVISVGGVKQGISEEYVMRILSMLANLGEVALARTYLIARIKEQSITDGLTGLYNHQYFQQKLDEVLNQATKQKRPLSLLIADIDHFKRLNDDLGHQMGDACLKQTARILKGICRDTDIIARYGGEEFVCILPEIDIQEAKNMALEINLAFKNTEFEFEGTKTKTTLSVGVSAYMPDEIDTIKKNMLIKQADQALYEAKRAGRDRVAVYK